MKGDSIYQGYTYERKPEPEAEQRRRIKQNFEELRARVTPTEYADIGGMLVQGLVQGEGFGWVDRQVQHELDRLDDQSRGDQSEALRHGG